MLEACNDALCRQYTIHQNFNNPGINYNLDLLHSAAIDRINTQMQTEIQIHKTKAQNRTNGLDSLFPSKCKFIRSGLVRWGCWKRKPHTLIQCTTSNIGLTRWGRWKKNQHSLNLTRSFLMPKRRSWSSRGCRPFYFTFEKP